MTLHTTFYYEDMGLDWLHRFPSTLHHITSHAGALLERAHDEVPLLPPDELARLVGPARAVLLEPLDAVAHVA